MRRYFAFSMLKDLTYKIEHTFQRYLNIYAFFFARFHLTTPPITNAKMVCEYMINKMRTGMNLRNTFISIKAWQQKSHLLKTRFYADFLSMHNFDVRDFKYPLKGIRIACSGPKRKARQAETVQYHVWVCDNFYTGRMPLSSFDLDLDYYQSVVVLRRSNIGIKVWLLFDKMETVK
jgi:hypothetical protein